MGTEVGAGVSGGFSGLVVEPRLPLASDSRKELRESNSGDNGAEVVGDAVVGVGRSDTMAGVGDGGFPRKEISALLDDFEGRGSVVDDFTWDLSVDTLGVDLLKILSKSSKLKVAELGPDVGVEVEIGIGVIGAKEGPKLEVGVEETKEGAKVGPDPRGLKSKSSKPLLGFGGGVETPTGVIDGDGVLETVGAELGCDVSIGASGVMTGAGEGITKRPEWGLVIGVKGTIVGVDAPVGFEVGVIREGPKGSKGAELEKVVAEVLPEVPNKSYKKLDTINRSSESRNGET